DEEPEPQDAPMSISASQDFTFPRESPVEPVTPAALLDPAASVESAASAEPAVVLEPVATAEPAEPVAPEAPKWIFVLPRQLAPPLDHRVRGSAGASRSQDHERAFGAPEASLAPGFGHRRTAKLTGFSSHDSRERWETRWKTLGAQVKARAERN